MTKLVEDDIELFSIELLGKLKYQYIYAPDIAPDASTSSASKPKRKTIEDVPLLTLLKKQYQIYPKIIFKKVEKSLTFLVNNFVH